MSTYWPTWPRWTRTPARSGVTGMRAPLARITTRFNPAPAVTTHTPGRRLMCSAVHAISAASATTYTYCTPSTRLSGVKTTASLITSTASTNHGHRNRICARLPMLPPVARPMSSPATSGTRTSKSDAYLIGRKSRRCAGQHLHAGLECALVDAEAGRVMGGRRFSRRHRPEHEIATGDSRQELGEIVADGQRPAEHAGLVAYELLRHVEHGAGDVRFVHQGHGSVHELEAGAHLELRVHRRQQVTQAQQRLVAQLGGERAQAALDRDPARHDVPCSVAEDVADSRVALHAFVLESFDHGVD